MALMPGKRDSAEAVVAAGAVVPPKIMMMAAAVEAARARAVQARADALALLRRGNSAVDQLKCFADASATDADAHAGLQAVVDRLLAQSRGDL